MIWPAKALQQGGKFATERSAQSELFLGDGVLQAQCRARQQQAVAAQVFGEITIVPASAVSGIANDGVGDVFQVAADLMLAPGDWR